MSCKADWAERPTDKYPPVRIDHEVTLTREMPLKAYDYWRARRGSRIMPSRADIHPRDMRDFLAHAGLIEARKIPGSTEIDYLVRLAGTAVEEIMGPITGKSFAEVLPPEIEARWRNVCDEVSRSHGPVSVSTRVAFQNKTWLRTEVFVGPLSDDGKEITMFFLGFATWPDFDETP